MFRCSSLLLFIFISLETSKPRSVEITCQAHSKTSISTVECSFDRDISKNQTSFRIEYYPDDCSFEEAISLLKCDWVDSKPSCSKNLGSFDNVLNWTLIVFEFNNTAINTLLGRYKCSLVNLPGVPTKPCREYIIQEDIHLGTTQTVYELDWQWNKANTVFAVVFFLIVVCQLVLIILYMYQKRKKTLKAAGTVLKSCEVQMSSSEKQPLETTHCHEHRTEANPPGDAQMSPAGPKSGESGEGCCSSFRPLLLT